MPNDNRPSSAATLAKAAVLGFALGPMLSNQARAYYVAYAGPWLVLAGGATTSGALTTGGVVAMVIVLSRDKRHNQDAVPEEQGEAARLIDSALVTAQGDLGLQLQLLAESPSSFDQLSTEFEAGAGPAVEALEQATNLPRAALALHWKLANGASGPANDEAAAQHIVTDFLIRIGPNVRARPDQAASFLWELAREENAPGFPNEARTHTWIAGWLGVSPDAVGTAMRTSVAEAGPNEDLRAAIYADPGRYLKGFTTALDQQNGASLQARVDTLTAEGRAALPPGTF